MDFDPRDSDWRDDYKYSQEPSRGGRGGSGARDDDDDWSEPGTRAHGRDNDGARSLGRGPGNDRQGSDGHEHHRDARWAEQDRGVRARHHDVRNAFTRHVHLPREVQRELVRDRDREYTLRGSESRTLATVGAFRVVSSRDLRDHNGRATDPRTGDLRHLREQGLITTTRVPGHREHAVALTKEGRALLENRRDHAPEHQQNFYAGLVRERELAHDVQVYRAYEQAEARLHERGARIERVVLDHELKSEYQKWLHARDKDRKDCDGHPDRTVDEVSDWAYDHDLPYFDDEVHFPDLRIEYQEPDGRWGHEDIEVLTPHYRGAHAASIARSGFSCYRGSSVRLGGRGSGGSGSAHRGGFAEEFL